MAQDCSRLARIMIAVVAEINHAPADLHLQASRGAQLGHEEPPREEPARLLAECDDRLDVGGPGEPVVGLESARRRVHRARRSPTVARGGRMACSATLKPMHAAQPMRLYQR